MINNLINVKIHFIGIGGIGMSGIAELMHDLGYLVQGSDLQYNENIKRLEKKGITIYIGHKFQNVLNIQAVVFSSAIKFNNPEIIYSKKNKIPLISRADMLGELMKNKKSIAVAGSHGKTTTTSLIGTILDNAGLDPTIVNGGIINSYSKNNRYGRGKWMVAEADESDGSFLRLPHELSVITNLDLEHLDYYKSKQNLINSFEKFILNLPFYGKSIVCYDDVNLKFLIKKIKTRKIITYSIRNNKADIFIDQISVKNKFTNFRLNINEKLFNSKRKINFAINAFGNHNVLNGTASIIIALLLGVKIISIKKSLLNYIGVKRRFTFIGKINSSVIYDDYAHHPTEIKATLSSAKKIGKNIIIVFQPHRFSRTKLLMNEFIKVLSKVKKLYIIKTYSAGEKKIKGATGKDLANNISKIQKNVVYLENEKKLYEYLIKDTQKRSVLIFMGAGSITKIAYKFVNKNNE